LAAWPAIARGKDKEPLARQLGAAHYIDSQAADPALFRAVPARL
jgi:hypothetical protein